MKNSNIKAKTNKVQAFQVYKSGMAIGDTNPWQTILNPESEFNDEILQKKINWYLYLGYTVKNI